MFHLAAWFETVASVAQQDIQPVPDSILTIKNGHFIPNVNLGIMAGYVSHAQLLNAQFNSATLRQTNPPFVRPISATLLPPNDPNIASYIRQPLNIMGQEELQLLTTNSAATSGNLFGLAWLLVNAETVPMGTPFTCAFNGTFTANPGQWSLVSFNLLSTLPVGQYTMISSECFGTTQIAHRWTFDNQYWRPGHLSFAVESDRSYRELYQCQFGPMGRFLTFSEPRLELLCNAADTAFNGYMTVVKTGPGQPNVPQ